MQTITLTIAFMAISANGNSIDIIANAKTWVDAAVPYSATAYHDGYRTDSAGYVSMAWELEAPGQTTENLVNFATKITKD